MVPSTHMGAPVTSVLRDLMPLSGNAEHCTHIVHRHTWGQNIHLYKIKIKWEKGQPPGVPIPLCKSTGVHDCADSVSVSRAESMFPFPVVQNPSSNHNHTIMKKTEIILLMRLPSNCKKRREFLCEILSAMGRLLEEVTMCLGGQPFLPLLRQCSLDGAGSAAGKLT